MLRCLVILCVAGAVLGGSPPTMPPQAQPAHADSGNEAHTGTYATSYVEPRSMRRYGFASAVDWHSGCAASLPSMQFVL